MPSQAQQPLQSPQTFSFCHPIGTRDGTLTKDSKLVNCFIEQTSNGMALVKRPGSSTFFAQTGAPQGTFNCNGRSYSILNDAAYDMQSGVATAIPSVTTGGQRYDNLPDVPFGTTLIKSPTGLWKFVGSSNGTGGTFTKVADSNYPAQTVAGLIYLDGIVYVMNTDGTILGSALEDPMTWPSLNFIQADLSLGQGMGLYRHLNYLVAYYTQGIQFYYDANAANGNVTTGTQLGPVTNAAWTSGLAASYSVVEVVDLTFFIAQDRKRGRVVMMTNGLEMQIVSTAFIGKILDRSSLGDNVRVWSLRNVGHTFYGLTLVDLNLTLVYDVGANQWYTWSSLINGVEQYFVGANYLNGQGMDLFQSLTTGAVFSMQPTLYQDSGVMIPVTSVTAIYDYGTINYKRIASLFCLGDNVNTSITVDFSDDDYNTWSGAKTISMLPTRKQIQRAGRFRRRAYRMKHQDNTPLRLVDGKLDASILAS
jgi:hypothetical protein